MEGRFGTLYVLIAGHIKRSDNQDFEGLLTFTVSLGDTLFSKTIISS